MEYCGLFQHGIFEVLQNEIMWFMHSTHSMHSHALCIHALCNIHLHITHSTHLCNIYSMHLCIVHLHIYEFTHYIFMYLRITHLPALCAGCLRVLTYERILKQ